MNPFIFLDTFEFFPDFLTFLQTQFKKNQVYNHKTVRSFTRKILESNMEFCRNEIKILEKENISKM